MRVVSLIVVGLLLSAGALMQLRSGRVHEVHPRIRTLAELLPPAPSGWTAIDELVAATPEAKRAVAEMLNYDEAVVRTYRSQNTTVSVYIAYWRPGKFHPRLIALHTPDICWPGAGWNMTKLGTLQLPAGARRTLSGQYRRFDAGEQTQFVIYWHMMGGRVIDYTIGDRAEALNFLATFWDDLRYPQQEQYFIRISASRPPLELDQIPPLTTILARLAEIGLILDSTGSSSRSGI